MITPQDEARIARATRQGIEDTANAAFEEIFKFVLLQVAVWVPAYYIYRSLGWPGIIVALMVGGAICSWQADQRKTEREKRIATILKQWGNHDR